MQTHPKVLKQQASQKLGRLTCRPRKLLLTYAAVSFGVSLLVALINLYMQNQMVQTVGLRGLEIQAIWQTASSLLDLAIAFLSPLWSLGLIFVALRFAREEDAAPQDLLAGFSRPGRGICLQLLTALLYVFMAFIAVYIGAILMVGMADMGHLSGILEPFAQAVEENPSLLEDPSFLAELPWQQLLPFLLVPLTVMCFFTIVLVWALGYFTRLAPYYLMDSQDTNPVLAIIRSFATVAKHFGAFFRLDLSYWWYFLLMAIISLFPVAIQMPSLFGGTPIHNGLFILVQACSALCACLLYFWKGAQVETTYALAFEKWKRKPNKK